MENADTRRRQVDFVEAKLSTHEEVCATRYKSIVERIQRLELVVMASAGTLICGMAGLLTLLLSKGLT